MKAIVVLHMENQPPEHGIHRLVEDKLKKFSRLRDPYKPFMSLYKLAEETVVIFISSTGRRNLKTHMS